jgi:hypothetical protein
MPKIGYKQAESVLVGNNFTLLGQEVDCIRNCEAMGEKR